LASAPFLKAAKPPIYAMTLVLVAFSMQPGSLQSPGFAAPD
jgi:hypothetical protein